MFKYVIIRKYILEKLTKIPEENRKKFISFSSVTLNFLVNAIILSIPVTLLLHFPYWKSVVCIWIIQPFFEHYYIWLRETWKDELIK